MANNPTLLDMILAVDGDRNTIPATEDGTGGYFSQQFGFQLINSLPLSAGGKAVLRQDLNGVFALLSGIAFMAQKGFCFKYDNGQDYYVGCMVMDPDDNLKYECIQDAPAGTGKPHTKPAYWRQVDLSTGNADTTPIGTVIAFGGTTAPDDYLFCDGSAISRSTYSDLFAVIGTRFGVGNGTTTFNLPNLVNKFIEGSASSGTNINAGLPDIQGGWTDFVGYQDTRDITPNAFESSGSARRASQDDDYNGAYKMDFKASRYNAIYGASNTVQPPAVTMMYCIKYK